MTTAIRKALRQEAAYLTALAMRSKAFWGYSNEFMQQAEAELTVTGADLDSTASHFFVAEKEGEISGFCSLVLTTDRTVELDRMYVAVEFIGSGTGRKLFEHAVQQVADYGGTEMIMQSDPHARGFYLAIGATEIGTRESGSIPGRFLPLLVLPVNDGNAPGP